LFHQARETDYAALATRYRTSLRDLGRRTRGVAAARAADQLARLGRELDRVQVSLAAPRRVRRDLSAPLHRSVAETTRSLLQPLLLGSIGAPIVGGCLLAARVMATNQAGLLFALGGFVVGLTVVPRLWRSLVAPLTVDLLLLAMLKNREKAFARQLPGLEERRREIMQRVSNQLWQNAQTEGEPVPSRPTELLLQQGAVVVNGIRVSRKESVERGVDVPDLSNIRISPTIPLPSTVTVASAAAI